MKNTMLALAIGFAVAGCASSPPTMDVDYDTAADFAAQKTFAWMPATGNAAANELLVKRIRSAVDKCSNSSDWKTNCITSLLNYREVNSRELRLLEP